MEQSPDLIDSIYECAMIPELWPDVLDRLAEVTGARGGLLFAANGRVVNWAASQSIRDEMARFASGDLIHSSPRFAKVVHARHAGFVREQDLYTDEELENDTMYRDLLWPAGLGWAAGTAFQVPTGDVVLLSVERERARGPVEDDAVRLLNALRPHIARSAMLSARLQLERARVASETLAALNLPAIVVDSRGRALMSNHLVEALGDFIRWRSQDVFALKDAKADQLLRTAFESLEADRLGAVRSFAVRQSDTRPGLLVHVVPIRKAARDVFARSAAVLVLMPVTMPNGPPVELVQSLFDLTPTEARVARSLASGDTVDVIAARSGVSYNTVRTQVRGILDKTGCHRQADVVALLSGIRSTDHESAP